MTTSINSKARRNQTSNLIRGRENLFPTKPDGQTERHTVGRTEIWTDIRTDINIYRVASLLKKDKIICGRWITVNVAFVWLVIKMIFST